ncbi:c-type cytochrome [Roseibium aggregatum]|uniref:c-type cytochrome n=1 Tax=Roseibium aggregatum TaxID=187304 RepID=UPI001E57B1AA|nr:c-type cytochrome [Roseibium aggregatum]
MKDLLSPRTTTSGNSAPLKLPWGSTLLLATSIVLGAQTARAQTTDGERLSQQRCASCYSLEESGLGAGPSLAGVVGQSAGSVEVARYSPEKFLEDPRGTVPDTMMVVRITDPAQRKAIIDFLETSAGAGHAG